MIYLLWRSKNGVKYMDAVKLSRNLIGLGILGVIASFIWWALFYSEVLKELGGRDSSIFDPDVMKCFVSNTGECGFITGMASMIGVNAYSPWALYAGLGLIALGVVIKFSQK